MYLEDIKFGWSLRFPGQDVIDSKYQFMGLDVEAQGQISWEGWLKRFLKNNMKTEKYASEELTTSAVNYYFKGNVCWKTILPVLIFAQSTMYSVAAN